MFSLRDFIYIFYCVYKLEKEYIIFFINYFKSIDKIKKFVFGLRVEISKKFLVM